MNGGSTHDEELNSSLTEVGGAAVVDCSSCCVAFRGFDGCLPASCLDGLPMSLAFFWAPLALVALGVGRGLVSGT